MLVASRFVQGVGEALAAPASLGLIALLFPNARERVKALGFWGGIAALGGTTGTVISGLVVGFASWRWIFFINLPVALFALLVVPRLVSESRMVRGSRRPDYAAAITGTFGLIAVVASLLQAATSPWGSAQVLLPLLGGLALVGLTVWLEAISASPLVPRAFFHNRTRVVTNCATLFSSGAFFCYFFLVTLFEQQVLRYSPLEGGLGYLPFGIAIGLGAGVGTALLPHLGAKRLLGAGFFCCAIGFLLTSGIGVHASYLGNLLPGMLVLGVASGLCFPAISNSSLHDVTGQDSSLASGVQSTMQQVGGALGLAFIVPLGLHHAADLIHGGVLPAVAATDGYVLALRVAAALLTIAGVFVLVCFEQAGALQRDAFEIVTATGSHPTEDVA
jgi:predicted MFS family arabinose efflux permease